MITRIQLAGRQGCKQFLRRLDGDTAKSADANVSVVSGGEDSVLVSRMFFVVLAAWLGGVGVSFYFGNRKFPIVAFLIGVVLLWLHFAGIAGPFGFAGLALLTAIIWIVNKADFA